MAGCLRRYQRPVICPYVAYGNATGVMSRHRSEKVTQLRSKAAGLDAKGRLFILCPKVVFDVGDVSTDAPSEDVRALLDQKIDRL